MTTSKAKAKGTGFEAEVRRAFEARGFTVRRTAPGFPIDMTARAEGSRGRVVDVLVTRPDRGQRLATVRLDDLIDLLQFAKVHADIEAKRHQKFAHHTLFEDTFR